VIGLQAHERARVRIGPGRKERLSRRAVTVREAVSKRIWVGGGMGLSAARANSWDSCNVPLEILEDDGAFVERTRRRVCVQFESGDETFGRHVEEILGFFIRVYFVCTTRVSRS
jgi:hypothetical protein